MLLRKQFFNFSLSFRTHALACFSIRSFFGKVMYMLMQNTRLHPEGSAKFTNHQVKIKAVFLAESKWYFLFFNHKHSNIPAVWKQAVYFTEYTFFLLFHSLTSFQTSFSPYTPAIVILPCARSPNS